MSSVHFECCCSKLQQMVLPTLPLAQNPERTWGKSGNRGGGENAVGPGTDISTASAAGGRGEGCPPFQIAGVRGLGSWNSVAERGANLEMRYRPRNTNSLL